MRSAKRMRLALWHQQVIAVVIFGFVGAVVWNLTDNTPAVYLLALSALFFQLASSWSLRRMLECLNDPSSNQDNLAAEVQSVADTMRRSQEQIAELREVLESFASSGSGPVKERALARMTETHKAFAELPEIVERGSRALDLLRKAAREDARARETRRAGVVARQRWSRQTDQFWQQFVDVWNGSFARHRTLVESIPTQLTTIRTLLRTLDRSQRDWKTEFEGLSAAWEKLIARLNEESTARTARVRDIEDLRSELRRIVEGLAQQTQASSDAGDRAQDIAELASRVNLMAINSLLESLRLNPDGKSTVDVVEFALVADEIRNVAEQAEAQGHELGEILRRNDILLRDAVGGVARSLARCESLLNAYRSAEQDLNAWIETSLSTTGRRNERRPMIEVASTFAEIDDLEKNLQVLDETRAQVDQIIPRIEDVLQNLTKGDLPSEVWGDREAPLQDLEDVLTQLRDVLARVRRGKDAA